MWIAAGSFTGMLVAWFWLGERLMAYSRQRNQITLTDFLVDDMHGRMRYWIVAVTSAIIIFSFTFYVVAQFQGAGNTFSSTFGLPMSTSVMLGASIILIYTLLGGFWAVSVTDTVQGGLMGVAALLSAIMSTADSQLLVAASAISHELGLGRSHPQRSLLISRLTIVALVVIAVVVALYLPEKIFSRVLFAWTALGSAFGPTVFLRLGGIRLRPVGVLLSILTGFTLAVVFYLMPNTPGDVLERAGPFIAAFTVLLLFRETKVTGET